MAQWLWSTTDREREIKFTIQISQSWSGKDVKELGIDCYAYGVQGTGLDPLPKDKNLHDLAMDFFRKSWKEDKRK